MWQAYNLLMSSIRGFGVWEWTLIGFLILGVGVFCMRGYGSRGSGTY